MANQVRILVVDDETASAMAMVSLFTCYGFGVEVAWKSEQVFKLAQNGNFDLIILGMNTHRINGFKVCEQLKADPRLHSTPFIFVSRNLSEETQRHAVQLAAADCIAKPYKGEDLISRITPFFKRKNQKEPDSLYECEELKAEMHSRSMTPLTK